MPSIVIDHVPTTGIALGCLRNRRVLVVLRVRLGFLAPKAEGPVGEVEGAEEDDGCENLFERRLVSEILMGRRETMVVMRANSGHMLRLVCLVRHSSADAVPLPMEAKEKEGKYHGLVAELLHEAVEDHGKGAGTDACACDLVRIALLAALPVLTQRFDGGHWPRLAAVALVLGSADGDFVHDVARFVAGLVVDVGHDGRVDDVYNPQEEDTERRVDEELHVVGEHVGQVRVGFDPCEDAGDLGREADGGRRLLDVDVSGGRPGVRVVVAVPGRPLWSRACRGRSCPWRGSCSRAGS
jgi:hypothetical protein